MPSGILMGKFEKKERNETKRNEQIDDLPSKISATCSMRLGGRFTCLPQCDSISFL